MDKWKQITMRLLGPELTGRLQYLVQPNYQPKWGGALNGQVFRRRMYDDLIANLPLKAIVETGTFRGVSTALFVESGLPVYTVEANPLYFGYSAMRFRRLRKLNRVHLELGDSRAFLRALAEDPEVPKTDALFYLDAHWHEDLPLREEIEVIFSNWSNSVVMVDDFEVPGTEYEFDSYGPDRTLNLAHLEPLSDLQLSIFFPAVEPAHETGAKRGSIVLCREKDIVDALGRLETLRQFNP